MTCSQMTLLHGELVEYASITLCLEVDGWRLLVMHRHRFGKWNDCERQEYSGLTLAEAEDVIDAVLTVAHANDCPGCVYCV